MTPSDNIPKKKSLMGNKAFSSFFGALLAVVIMVLLILVYNISSQMEDLETKLAYRPPTMKGSAIPAAAVISGKPFMCRFIPIFMPRAANRTYRKPPSASSTLTFKVPLLSIRSATMTPKANLFKIILKHHCKSNRWPLPNFWLNKRKSKAAPAPISK